MFYICSMSDVHVIWFRRDLRIHDHAALNAAMASGARILPLYIFEPSDWSGPHRARRQFDFLIEALQELSVALQARGASLIIRTGEAVEVFSALHRQHGLSAIHVHEETGALATRLRDQAIRRWARNAGVSFREQPLCGIPHTAAPRSPEEWARLRHEFLSRPRLAAPQQIPALNIASEEMPLASDFGLPAEDCPGRQRGGRSLAVDYLRNALARPLIPASDGLPLEQPSDTLWRILSAPLAFGTLSLREVWQALRRAAENCYAAGQAAESARLDLVMAGLLQRHASLPALAGPLPATWRPAAQNARSEEATSSPRFIAWINGQTGFPLVDACMRAAARTGWLDMPLRRFVMDFARHYLRLDTDHAASHLAARLTDGDTGAHYPSARIPNPVRLSRELDPDAAFLRLYLPELASLPDTFLHAPWEAPARILASSEIILGQTYPMRIVDHVAAAGEARNRMAALRPRAPAAPSAPRQRISPAPAPRPSPPEAAQQLQLSFDLRAPEPAR